MPPEARVMFATLLFFAAVGGSTLPGGNDLAREIVLTRHVGAESEDDEIIRAQVEAGHAGGGAVAFQRLGWAYIAKARRTFDPGYYKLAEKSVDVVDRDFGASPESRLLRGHVLHNLHRFREAESAARQNVAERGLPVDFALLSDALIEQGKLEQGIAALQRMVDLRPGCEAMSRVAHVRWLRATFGARLPHWNRRCRPRIGATGRHEPGFSFDCQRCTFNKETPTLPSRLLDGRASPSAITRRHCSSGVARWLRSIDWSNRLSRSKLRSDCCRHPNISGGWLTRFGPRDGWRRPQRSKHA
jgi:hypothetical protein